MTPSEEKPFKFDYLDDKKKVLRLRDVLVELISEPSLQHLIQTRTLEKLLEKL